MRQTAVGEPEVLVEPGRTDDHGVPVPLAHRTAVVKRIVRITAKLALLRASVVVDDSVVAIAAPDEHEDSFAIAVFVELNAVGKLVLAGAARRHAKQVHRIIF